MDDAAVPAAVAAINYVFFDDDAQFEAALDTLVEAFSTNIEWVRKHTEFGEYARRWMAAGGRGPRGLLLRSPLLEEAERWIAARPANAPAPTHDVQSFIIESRRAATRRRNILTASLGAGLALALVLSAVALWQRRIAIKNEVQANLERDGALTTQSLFLSDLARQRRLDFGDAADAVGLALEPLPDRSRIRPYVPEGPAQARDPRSIAALFLWRALPAGQPQKIASGPIGRHGGLPEHRPPLGRLNQFFVL